MIPGPVVAVVAPVVEEFAYRGLVQQGFRRIGGHRVGAVVLTSVLFVFMHLPVVPTASILSAATTSRSSSPAHDVAMGRTVNLSRNVPSATSTDAKSRSAL